MDAFYNRVKQFYQSFITKLLDKLDFKSDLFKTLKLLDPQHCLDLPLDVFDKIADLLPLSFEKAAVNLEFREFVADRDVCSTDDQDAVEFWLSVLNMKSALGEYRYTNLGRLALQLLAIPTSNADSERVFSLVRRIQTDFRSQLIPETISALIGVHYNTNENCCEGSNFDSNFLKRQNPVLTRRT